VDAKGIAALAVAMFLIKRAFSKGLVTLAAAQFHDYTFKEKQQ